MFEEKNISISAKCFLRGTYAGKDDVNESFKDSKKNLKKKKS